MERKYPCPHKGQDCPLECWGVEVEGSAADPKEVAAFILALYTEDDFQTSRCKKYLQEVVNA